MKILFIKEIFFVGLFFGNGKTFLTKPEIITKYYFKTFDHFSNPF